MALRFLMGAAEIAYGPGVPFLLSFFYLRHELGLRCGLFLSAAPLANTFAGALAYGITSGNPGMAKWRVLFLVEGLPTVVMAAVAFFFLPDSPEKAKFLNEEEKAVARARGVAQAGAGTRIGAINWKEMLEGLMDLKGWILGVSLTIWYGDIKLTSNNSSCTSLGMLHSRHCRCSFPRFSTKWGFRALMRRASQHPHSSFPSLQ